MLHPSTPVHSRALDVHAPRLQPDTPPLTWILRVTRKRCSTIILATIVVFGSAALYVSLTTRHYTATARLAVDTHKSQSGMTSIETAVDSGVIETQIETISSKKTVLAAVARLNLENDPKFQYPTLLTRMLQRVGLNGVTERENSEVTQWRAVDRIARLLKVNQVGHSYLAEIRFTWTDPETAARVVNAIADSYIDGQLEARISTAARAVAWVDLRLHELGRQANDAAKAVEAFKAEGKNAEQADQSPDGERQSRLHALETTANSLKQSYDTFQNLNRYSQTAQQQSFPITDARVLSPAIAPVEPSSPKRDVVLFLSMLAGSGLGLAIALTQELMDRTIQTRTQLEQQLNIKYLGCLPLIRQPDVVCDFYTKPTPARRLSFWRRDRTQFAASHDASPSFSPARDALVGVWIAIDSCDQASSQRTLGIISTGRSEGKTTVAVNLAHIMAQAGKKVLLVDADFRRATLTRLLAPASNCGLRDALKQTTAIGDLLSCTQFGFWFLPGSAGDKLISPPELLCSAGMGKLLADTRDTYDRVILDISSAPDHLDVRAIAGLLDGLVLVLECGRTRIDDVDQLLTQSPFISERIIGAIVNKLQTRDGSPSLPLS